MSTPCHPIQTMHFKLVKTNKLWSRLYSRSSSATSRTCGAPFHCLTERSNLSAVLIDTNFVHSALQKALYLLDRERLGSFSDSSVMTRVS